MSELWTSEAPAKNGFYWWKIEAALHEEVVQLHQGTIWVTGSNARFPIDHWKDQQWGPMVPDACKLNAMVQQSRSLLIMLMESYSEEHYAAGWIIGLEYRLWDRIKQPLDKTITDQDADEYLIAVASRVTNGWVVCGDEDEDPKWIPMQEWEAILAERFVKSIHSGAICREVGKQFAIYASDGFREANCGVRQFRSQVNGDSPQQAWTLAAEQLKKQAERFAERNGNGE